MVLIIVKLVLIALIGIVVFRIARAKQGDSSLELKFNARSWAEVFIVFALDFFILVHKPSADREFIVTLLGQVMIVVTFLHTRRYVFVGRDLLYMLEHTFSTKDVSNVRYEKSVLKLEIRDTEVKVRVPLADVDNVLERFSGKMYQKKGK